MVELEGAIHIHTTYSDGTADINEISKYASEVGLDFIMITDHNTLKAKEDGFEGWNNNVLVIVGYELNDLEDKNHYLVFGLDSLPPENSTAGEYVKFVNEKNGLGFIAHPNEDRKNLKKHPAYPWTEWDVKGFNGIEIWNHMSEWIEGLTDNNRLNRLFHPLKSIQGPKKKDLELWDKLNTKQNVVGIGSLDAHAFKQDILGFIDVEIFPYKVLFKSIRTHVLIPKRSVVKNKKSALSQMREINSALKAGRCFIGNYYHGDAKGFRFTLSYRKNTYNLGDSLKIKKGETAIFQVFVPMEGNINLIRNGEKIFSTNGLELIYDCKESGNYRVEVYRENKTWIISNNIKIIN